MIVYPRQWLGTQERRALERLTGDPGTPPRLAQRARIVLHASTGATNREVAERAGVSIPTVALWRGRYAEHGLDGLGDLPRQRPAERGLRAVRRPRRPVGREPRPPARGGGAHDRPARLRGDARGRHRERGRRVARHGPLPLQGQAGDPRPGAPVGPRAAHQPGSSARSRPPTIPWPGSRRSSSGPSRTRASSATSTCSRSTSGARCGSTASCCPRGSSTTSAGWRT